MIGDFVLFKGNGFLFNILSFVLSVFNKEWRDRQWKPWHVGFIVQEGIVCEALAGGVTLNPLSKYSNYKIVKWFDSELDQVKVDAFVKKHKGEKYDILVYPLTAIAYLVRHYWGRPIPRLFDNSWSCWELLYYFADKMGKPIAEDYDFPLISDLCEALGI
jgi:hypothetical protein